MRCTGQSDVDSWQGRAGQPNPSRHIADRQDKTRTKLCDIKQRILGSADGSNTQPQQETLIVKGGGPQKTGSTTVDCVWLMAGRLAVLSGLSLRSQQRLLRRISCPGPWAPRRSRASATDDRSWLPGGPDCTGPVYVQHMRVLFADEAE